MTDTKDTRNESLVEQCARLAGYGEALVGLTEFVGKRRMPHIIAKYREGFIEGRAERARRFGARDRAAGRPEKCPDEFRLQENKAAYADGYWAEVSP